MIDLVMWDLDETMLPTEYFEGATRYRTMRPHLLPDFAGSHCYDGVADAVLQTPDVRTGVVTSSPRWYVEKMLDGPSRMSSST